MTLKQIRTTNLQSHRSVVLDLPEFGVVRLGGPNSSGKSVVLKPLNYLLDKQIAHPKTRASLISRGTSFGEATYVRQDDVELTIHVTVDASTTYVSLKYPDKDPIIRYLADKNYRDLAYEFGFHYNEDRGISINISEGDKSILFYKTNGPTNMDILDIALSDGYAQTVLDNLEETAKITRDFRDKAITSVQIIDSALSELKTYDVEVLQSKLSKLQTYYNILSSIYVPDIPEIVPVPKVKSVAIYEPYVPDIRWPRIVSVETQLTDITTVAEELKVLRANTCPLCGRSFEC